MYHLILLCWEGLPEESSPRQKIAKESSGSCAQGWSLLCAHFSQCALDMGMRGSAGPWKVNPRWVLDSEKFNEWMNPVDYETEEAIAEQERLGLLIEGPSGTHI